MQGIKAQAPPSPKQDAAAEIGIDTQLVRLSSAELSELVASLPDSTLAHVVIVTIRQLRRRLARIGRGSAKRPTSVLERAAQQLVAELGEHGDYDDS